MRARFLVPIPAVLAVLVSAAFATTAAAQLSSSTLTGVVRSAGGAPVAHATVTLSVAGQPEVIEHKGFNPVKAVMEAFADAVQGRAPYPVTHDQIVHGVAVFEAIVRSAQTGQPVKVIQ